MRAFDVKKIVLVLIMGVCTNNITHAQDELEKDKLELAGFHIFTIEQNKAEDLNNRNIYQWDINTTRSTCPNECTSGMNFESDYFKFTGKFATKGTTSLDVRDHFLYINVTDDMAIKILQQNSIPTISGDSRGERCPLQFSAKEYTFKKGKMKVEGSIECKGEMKVTQIDTKDIRTNDITVDMNNAADYVFDENYDLKSLGDVENFVKNNKHLPGVPSATEMAENGMSLAEMSNILLQKVEELTLHMIEMNKQINYLKEENESLKSQIGNK